MIPDHTAHSSPLVERFEQWVRRQLAEGSKLRRRSTCNRHQRTHAGAAHT